MDASYSIKANLFFSFKNFHKKNLISLFFLFLLLGNIPRFLPLKGLAQNISILELIIYVAAHFYLLFSRSLIKKLSNLIPCFFLILMSCLWGIFNFGFNLVCVLYATRFVLMFSTSYIIAIVSADYWKGNIYLFCKFFLTLYFSNFFFGFLIFIFFPQSEQLWLVLKAYGIQLTTDPHSGRFVSLYFDPNYYAAIICFAYILSVFMYKISNKLIYAFLAFCFFISIILSGSRSGFGIFFLINIFYLIKVLCYNNRLILRKRWFFLFTFFCLFALSTLIYYKSELLFLVEKLTKPTDLSAYARYVSFKIGRDLMAQYPLFGVGFNYQYYLLMESNHMPGVDSSFLSTLINFGILNTSILFAFFILWIFNIFKEIKKSEDCCIKNLYYDVLFYILVVLFFGSIFNNLIYYQFWFIPISVFLNFMGHASQYREVALNNSEG